MVRYWWSNRWIWWSALLLSVVFGVGGAAVALSSGAVVVAYVLAATAWSPLGLVLWYRLPAHPMGPLITLVGLVSYSIVPAFLMGGFFEQFPAAITPSA